MAVIEAEVVTTSDKVAVIFIIAPSLYEPSAVVDEKLLTVGRVVSTVIDLFAASDPAAVGAGRVSIASVLAEFLIVPLFSASESVAT